MYTVMGLEKPGRPAAAAVTRRHVIVVVAVGVALLHPVTGPRYSGLFPAFVNGYLIDILLPFSFYLLLCLPDHRAIRSPLLRCLAILAGCWAAETLQAFGVPIFGRTFDPLDLGAYAIGVALGLLVEATVLARLPR
jgi:hypothetical protein